MQTKYRITIRIHRDYLKKLEQINRKDRSNFLVNEIEIHAEKIEKIINILEGEISEKEKVSQIRNELSQTYHNYLENKQDFINIRLQITVKKSLSTAVSLLDKIKKIKSPMKKGFLIQEIVKNSSGNHSIISELNTNSTSPDATNETLKERTEKSFSQLPKNEAPKNEEKSKKNTEMIDNEELENFLQF